ncbi:Conserved_hypothetical protein [Hexamita inflata]|uniref:Capsid protein n=1 Tax=Hexamita inflata TaxID=28002 RepID=A0AA86NQ18_9EUKA|nr:Conserved hypothetical protein [Hexamita inflata]CAI9923723.1 Conserved hypothetical protein [Hexamita inflata]
MSDDKKVQIIPANVKKFQNLGNIMVMSTGNNGNGAVINRQRAENQEYFSSVKPGNYKPNANFQFTIVTGKGLLSTNQSYINYTMKYALKVPITVTYNGTPAATGSTHEFGKYYVQNKGFGPWWYFEQYKFDTGKWVPDTSKPITAKCAFPMNSRVPFNKSQYIYRNITNQDDDIFRQTARMQQQLPNEYQNAHNQTWFNGDLPSLEFFALPYKYTNLADKSTKTYMEFKDATVDFLDNNNDNYPNEYKITKGTPAAGKISSSVTYYFTKTYTIPLNVTNQIFDSTNTFPLSVLGYEQIRLNLYLQAHYMNKIFGTDALLDKTDTGIIDLELVLVSKDSDIVKAELNSKDGFSYHYMKFDRELLPSIDQSLSVHRLLNRGHQSTADVIVGLNLSDENKDDSMYLKQRFTPFTGEQQLKIINNEYDQNEEFNWFSQFNLWKGNRSNALFSQDLENLTQFKCEMLRGLNLYNQYERGTLNYDSMFKIMFQYATITLNLEAFSIDTNEDVVNDGVDSINQKLYVDFKIGYYQNSQKAIPYNAKTQTNKTLISGDTPLNIEVIQIYDCILKFNPTKQNMSIDENFASTAQLIQ